MRLYKLYMKSPHKVSLFIEIFDGKVLYTITMTIRYNIYSKGWNEKLEMLNV